MKSSNQSINALWIFLAIYSIAAQINHIDETDETYGYWEPLHYFLYGVGMQTWEYSPGKFIIIHSDNNLHF